MPLLLRNGVWYARFQVKKIPIYQSTKTGNRRLAEQIYAKLKNDLVQEAVLQGKTPITLFKAIDEFVASRSTLASAGNCRTKMAWFRNAISDQPLKSVSQKAIIEVVEKHTKDGFAKSTISTAIIYWNTFVKYCEDKNYSVCGKLKGIGSVKGKLRWLTVDEENALLAALDCLPGLPERFKVIRRHNRDFIICLLDTGARYNEIAKMEWRQVNLDKNTLHISRQKGGTDTVLQMTNRMRAVLQQRKAEGLTVATRPANEQKWFDDAIKRAGLSCVPSKPTLHTLRHTAATRFLQGGGTIQQLQYILGHRSIDSTMIYAHLVEDDASKLAAEIFNRVQIVDAPALKLVG